MGRTAVLEAAGQRRAITRGTAALYAAANALDAAAGYFDDAERFGWAADAAALRGQADKLAGRVDAHRP